VYKNSVPIFGPPCSMCVQKPDGLA